jgi:hypothetical protein
MPNKAEVTIDLKLAMDGKSARPQNLLDYNARESKISEMLDYTDRTLSEAMELRISKMQAIINMERQTVIEEQKTVIDVEGATLANDLSPKNLKKEENAKDTASKLVKEIEFLYKDFRDKVHELWPLEDSMLEREDKPVEEFEMERFEEELKKEKTDIELRIRLRKEALDCDSVFAPHPVIECQA